MTSSPFVFSPANAQHIDDDEDNHDHDDGTYITSPLPSQAKNSSPKGSASKISIKRLRT